MEIKYLQEFVVLAETCNFSEAAQRLYISTSTLSKHIKSVETELGVLLFDRTSRSVQLNEYGEILLPYAKEMMRLQQRYTQEIENSLFLANENLTISSVRSMAPYHIMDILANFKKERPQATVNIIHPISSNDTNDYRQYREVLRERKCDLSVIPNITAEDKEEFGYVSYVMDKLVAVVPKTHQLAKQSTISFDMLKGEPLLFIDERTFTSWLCYKRCEEHGFTPNVVFTDWRADNLIELAGNGIGIALFFSGLALNSRNPNIAIIEITPKEITEIGICYRKDEPLSVAAKEFLKILNLQREENINNWFLTEND